MKIVKNEVQSKTIYRDVEVLMEDRRQAFITYITSEDSYSGSPESILLDCYISNTEDFTSKECDEIVKFVENTFTEEEIN